MFLSIALFLLCESTVIRLNDQLLRVDLAKTQQEQMQGLSGRAKLDEDEGMLFVYSRLHSLRFWMKGMRIPLSIGFFDEKRVLINVQEMSLPKHTDFHPKEYLTPRPALYALEMPSEWFQRHNVVLGSRFEWVDPPQ